jgi:hypothetical protein
MNKAKKLVGVFWARKENEKRNRDKLYNQKMTDERQEQQNIYHILIKRGLAYFNEVGKPETIAWII